MQRPPALVAAEDAAERRAPPARRARRRTRPRSGPGTTDCQRGRIAHSASATMPIAPITPSGPPSAVPSGLDGQQDVRRQQDQTGDRDAAMPDRGTVDPVEPLLDPGQRADEHQADRQQQDRLGAQQLPDVAPGGLARRAARRSTGRPGPRRGRRSSSARPRGRRTSHAARAPRHGSAARPPARATTGGSRCPAARAPRRRAPRRARRSAGARRRAPRPARRSRTSR